MGQRDQAVAGDRLVRENPFYLLKGINDGLSDSPGGREPAEMLNV